MNTDKHLKERIIELSGSSNIVCEDINKRTIKTCEAILDNLTQGISFHVRGGHTDTDLFYNELKGRLKLSNSEQHEILYVESEDDIDYATAICDVYFRRDKEELVLVVIKGDGMLYSKVKESGILDNHQYIFIANYGSSSRYSERCHDGTIYFSHLDDFHFASNILKDGDVAFIDLTDYVVWNDYSTFENIPKSDDEYIDFINKLGLGGKHNHLSASPNHPTQNISAKNSYQKVIDKIFQVTLSSFIMPEYRRSVYISGPRQLTGKTSFITAMIPKPDLEFGDMLNAHYTHVVTNPKHAGVNNVVILDDIVPLTHEPDYKFMSLISPTMGDKATSFALSTTGSVYITSLPSILNHIMSDDKRPLYINLNDFITYDIRDSNGNLSDVFKLDPLF